MAAWLCGPGVDSFRGRAFLALAGTASGCPCCAFYRGAAIGVGVTTLAAVALALARAKGIL